MISYDIDSLLYLGRYKAAKRIGYMFPSSFAADKLFIKRKKKKWKIKQKMNTCGIPVWHPSGPRAEGLSESPGWGVNWVPHTFQPIEY